MNPLNRILREIAGDMYYTPFGVWVEVAGMTTGCELANPPYMGAAVIQQRTGQIN